MLSVSSLSVPKEWLARVGPEHHHSNTELPGIHVGVWRTGIVPKTFLVLFHNHLQICLIWGCHAVRLELWIWGKNPADLRSQAVISVCLEANKIWEQASTLDPQGREKWAICIAPIHNNYLLQHKQNVISVKKNWKEEQKQKLKAITFPSLKLTCVCVTRVCILDILICATLYVVVMTYT